MTFHIPSTHASSAEHRANALGLSSRWAARTLCLLISTCLVGQAMAQSVPQSTYQYDAQGHPTRQIDPLGHTTEQSWNGLGLPTEQRLPHPTGTGTQGKIQYGYDGQGNLKSVTDPKGLATTYTTDGLGNTTALTSPDTGTSQYQYDAAGNLTQKTDARGKTATYTYDANNRLTKIVYGDQTVTYTYDEGVGAKGQLTRMTDASGTTRWTFDAQGRLSTRIQTRAGQSKVLTTRYQYDTQGRLSSMIYPSGRIIAYQYDAAGQVQQISLDGQAQLKEIRWQAFGPVKSWKWTQGGTQGGAQGATDKTVSRQYDLNGRPTSLTNAQGSRQINWDDASRITSITHQTDTTTQTQASATYDNLDRLTQNVTPLGTDTYQFDANGNRTAQAHDSQSTTHTVSPTSNRLIASSGTGPDARSYQYDASGNITADGQASYTYDNSGRLTSQTRSGQTTTYAYNGLGQRLTKQTGTGGTSSFSEFVYDESGHLIGEYDSDGIPVQEHIWLGDTPVLMAQGARGTAVQAMNHPGSPSLQSEPVIQRQNWALASQGSVASASSTYSGEWGTFPVSAINDAEHTGKNWGNAGVGAGWNDDTVDQFPDWVVIDFKQLRSVDEIDVITAQTALGTGGVKEPTLTDTFTVNGITDFDVQVWKNNAWETVQSGQIRNNDKVWQQIHFPSVQTDKVRIMIYAAQNRTDNNYSRLIEVEAWGSGEVTPPPSPVANLQNWALASLGGVASASSTYSGEWGDYPVNAVNDGDRMGKNWSKTGTGGGWNDDTENQFPDWVQIDLQQLRPVQQINVITAQTALGTSGVKEPALTDTFNINGITDFDVQIWTNNAWQTVPGGAIRGSDKVWQQINFPSVQTDKVRILIYGAKNNQYNNFSRLIEVEALGQDGETPPPTPGITGLYQVYADQIDTPRSLVDASTGKTVWTWEGEAFGNTPPNEDPQQSGHATSYNLRFPGQYYDNESKLFYNYFRDYNPQTGRYIQSDPIGLNGGVNTYSYVGGRALDRHDAFGLLEIFNIKGVSIHAYAKGDGSNESGPNGPHGNYHVHLNGDPKKVVDVDTLIPENPNLLTTQEKKALASLTENEKKYLQKACRETFHNNAKVLPKLKARYFWGTIGTIYILMTTNSYEEMCTKDYLGQMDDVCQ